MTVRQVIDSGTCIGCGACTVVAPTIKIAFNRFGDLVANLPENLSDADLAAASAVCPFAATRNEDQIAATVFAGSAHDPEIGHYLSTYAGYAPEFRAHGSSGGIVTWVLGRLLTSGLVDAVIHVTPSEAGPGRRLFDYSVSQEVSEIAGGSTSFYYPVSMDGALQIIRARPGRYAITGVPCFNKALRLLREQDKVLDERIAFQIGIVCGQMKSSHYVEYLAGHAGVRGELKAACFRRKMPGLPADDYAFEATYLENGAAVRDGETAPLRKAHVLNSKIGANWGMGYFKPEACEYCDDVVAETADIAGMDAWLPQYVKDGAGWSLVVVRHPALQTLMQDGQRDGGLVLEAASAKAVADSQRGGFNHRRGALGYRLWLKRGQWTPVKRFKASSVLPFWHRVEQRARAWLRESSRRQWLTTGHVGNFPAFQKYMRRLEFVYKVVTRMKRKFG